MHRPMLSSVKWVRFNPLVVSGSGLPLRGGGLTDRSLQRRANGAVSRFGTMSPVSVRVTTLVFGPVKFDRVIKLVHYTELAVAVVNRQQPFKVPRRY